METLEGATDDLVEVIEALREEQDGLGLGDVVGQGPHGSQIQRAVHHVAELVHLAEAAEDAGQPPVFRHEVADARIQVEHPVTELVTGIDLIKQQSRVAAGEPLSMTQDQVSPRGHAFECRINAEDPKTFAPCPGKVNRFHAPGGNGIRIDSHLYSGYTVPPNYDSLIGKVITWADDRHSALMRMRNALDEIVVDGITTNIPLHQNLVRDEAFQRGGVSIHYLEKKLKS